MDERRDVAKQAVLDYLDSGPKTWPRSLPQLWRVLDVAIAAIDAAAPSPAPVSEAEVGLAHKTFIENLEWETRDGVLTALRITEAMRAALEAIFAARNAGRES